MVILRTTGPVIKRTVPLKLKGLKKLYYEEPGAAVSIFLTAMVLPIRWIGLSIRKKMNLHEQSPNPTPVGWQPTEDGQYPRVPGQKINFPLNQN